MWFLVGAVLVLTAIMVFALASDVRRKAKLRRLNETSQGRSREPGQRAWTEQAVRGSTPLGQQGSGMGNGSPGL